MLTGTTSIDELIQSLNISTNILRYNSEVETSVKQNGGSVLYSYNNIIIASEISEEFYAELQKNPYIEYIDSLPLKKYGDINTDLINQIDVSKIFIGDSVDSSGVISQTDSQMPEIYINTNTGSTRAPDPTTNEIDGVSGKSRPPRVKPTVGVEGSTYSSVGIPPIITNQLLEVSSLSNVFFDYTITASGTGPITFEIIKPLNYVGSLDLINNGKMTGKSSNLGYYNITLKAKNIYGVDTRTLKLIVSESVEITNTNLDVYNKSGSTFSYKIESSGSLPKNYSTSTLPSGITLSGNSLNGVFAASGVYNITLIVSGTTTSNSKILSVTVGSSPIITSDGEITIEEYSGLTYNITSSPSSGVTYNVIGILPKGLRFNVNKIEGIPIITGIYYVTLKATNNFGESTKSLKITIYQT